MSNNLNQKRKKMKQMILLAILMILLAILMMTGCTENERAKNWGGTMTVDLPCGQQLYDVTWKGDDFWYATKPMPDGYTPVTYNFQADSSYGVFEGKVLIKECR